MQSGSHFSSCLSGKKFHFFITVTLSPLYKIYDRISTKKIYALKIDFNAFTGSKKQVWFTAKDIAELLGYTNREKTITINVGEDNQKTYLLYRSGHVWYRQHRCQAVTSGVAY